MAILVTNNASAEIALSLTPSDTSIILAAGQGDEFPSPGASDYFYVTLVDSSNNIEIVKCTSRSADTLTVVRGQDNTTARSFAVGSLVELRIVAATFTDLQSEIVPTFPAGTVMLFAQAAAPTGWTQVTTQNNKALRVVSGTGGGTGGTVAFTTAFSNQNVGDTALSLSQIPGHAHTFSGSTSGVGDHVHSYTIIAAIGGSSYTGGGSGMVSTTTGGAGAHDHGFSGTTSTAGSGATHNHALNLAVQYVDIIMASKD